VIGSNTAQKDVPNNSQSHKKRPPFPSLTIKHNAALHYVKGSVIGTLDIGQQRRLHEIGQLMDTHLKKVHDEELARGTKEAAEEDRFQW
jgi:hypothetical protein